MATTAIRANRESELDRQVAATGIPVLNEEALAASIEEWKAQDVSYQRAQNDAQREQIESAYRAGQQRLATAKQEIKDRAVLDGMQEQQEGITKAQQLQSEYADLMQTTPDLDVRRMPIEKLRRFAMAEQEITNLTGVDLQQAQPQPRPETFPDGKTYQLKNLPDGQLEVQLITGERFIGDPLTVTQRMAEAQVNTKLWARHKVAQAPTQPTAEPTQLNQQQQIIPPESTQQTTIADWMAEQQGQALAKRYGFSSEAEMVADYQSITQFRDQYNDQLTAMEFMTRCPEFPQTEAANQALLGIVESNNWSFTPDNMQAAHLMAVQNHMYQPLTQEQIRAANGVEPQNNRAAAPPMIHGNSVDGPNSPHTAPDPYGMPMDQLRKMAIKQELEKSGARYGGCMADEPQHGKRKTPQQHKKLGQLLAQDVPVGEALREVGYSERQAMKGWAAVPDKVFVTLPKKAQRLMALGKTDKESRKNLVRGRLVENVVKGKDGGSMSAKILGSDTELSMFQPDFQAGLVVIQMPQQAIDRKAELLEKPRDE